MLVLNVLRISNKPTAAAFPYNINQISTKRNVIIPAFSFQRSSDKTISKLNRIQSPTTRDFSPKGKLRAWY